MSDSPDVVGTSEAAEILGVSVPMITRYRKQGRLPKPVALLAATDVWMREDIKNRADGAGRRKLALVGTKEVADLLDVDRSQIGRWRRAGKFPEPCVELVAGPLWWARDIKAWARKRAKS